MKKYILLALVCVLGSCSHSIKKEQTENQPPLGKSLGFSILYSSNIDAEIAPCGCRSNPLGGTQRRLNWKNSLDEKLGGNTKFLSIDSGDTFFPTTPAPEYLLPQYMVQAKNLVRAYNALDVQYFSPGELDFAGGLHLLLSILRNAKFQTINSNIVYSNSEQSVFKTFDVFTVGDKKIGIFGLIDPDLSLPDEIKALNPSLIAVKMISTLKAKNVDIIILLSHLSTPKDEILVAQTSGIDYIFGAHSMNFLTQPLRKDSTLIFEASLRGEHIGIFNGESNHLVDMGENFDSDVKNPNQLDLLIKKNKTEIAKLNETLDRVLLSNNQNPQPFKGANSCIHCHKEQNLFVQNTRHSHAYQTLKSKGEHKNLQCLACHTLGQGMPGGYSNVKNLTPQFHNVQCENCHGPSGHDPLQRVGMSTCLKCHHEDRAPTWYKDGRPNYAIITEKYRLMSCPSMR